MPYLILILRIIYSLKGVNHAVNAIEVGDDLKLLNELVNG